MWNIAVIWNMEWICFLFLWNKGDFFGLQGSPGSDYLAHGFSMDLLFIYFAGLSDMLWRIGLGEMSFNYNKGDFDSTARTVRKCKVFHKVFLSGTVYLRL